jgi:hypothetical protein
MAAFARHALASPLKLMAAGAQWDTGLLELAPGATTSFSKILLLPQARPQRLDRIVDKGAHPRWGLPTFHVHDLHRHRR